MREKKITKKIKKLKITLIKKKKGRKYIEKKTRFLFSFQIFHGVFSKNQLRWLGRPSASGSARLKGKEKM